MHYYYDSTSNDAALLLSEKLKYIIKTSKDSRQETIILCVGSDRSTGDSLGPIVGYKLKKHMQCNFYVYGDLTHPVHAANLSKYIECINQTFINPYIIAVDASLGRKDHVGLITLGAGPLRPGLGVKKKLPEVGNVHITGIVNPSPGLTANIVLPTPTLDLCTSMDKPYPCTHRTLSPSLLPELPLHGLHIQDPFLKG